jgi:PAS domain S-box-containing protein
LPKAVRGLATIHGLRAHLAALTAAALLPAFAVGVIAVGVAMHSYRRAFEDRLEATAAALAGAVRTEIDVHILAVAALAASPAFDDGGEVASIHAPAQHVASMLDTRIFVLAPDLSMVLHTHFPAGTRFPVAPRQASVDAARQAFETGRPAVGNLLHGEVTGKMVTPVYVPVIRNGRVAYAIGIAVGAERLSRLLGEQTFADGGYASVVDAQGRIVARSTDTETYVGQQVRDWVVHGASAAPAGMLRGTNRAGLDITTAFRHVSSTPGWFVTVAEPLSAYHASLWTPLVTLGLGGLGAGAIALWTATAIGRRIMRPMVWLTAKAERVAATGGAAEFMPQPSPIQVQEFIRLRDAVLQAHVALRDRASDIVEGEARLRAVVDTAADAIVVTDEAGTIKSLNRAAEMIFGYAEAEAVGQNISLLLGVGNGDLATCMRTGERRTIGAGREIEGERKDGTTVPLDLAVAAWRDSRGRGFFTGIMRDISARRADEARRALLAREVDHRAKNVLAVIQAVLRLTRADEPRAYAAAVSARVAALARAHSLLAECGWSGADLRAVALREVSPYAPVRRDDTALTIDGPPVMLAPAMVQPFSMVLHELATNAVQHGALSAADGRVTVQWVVGGDRLLTLRWSEAGGPPVPSAPDRRGFGTKLIEATVRGQLSGTVEFHWSATGLVVEITVPLGQGVTEENALSGADAVAPSGVAA